MVPFRQGWGAKTRGTFCRKEHRPILGDSRGDILEPPSEVNLPLSAGAVVEYPALLVVDDVPVVVAVAVPRPSPGGSSKLEERFTARRLPERRAIPAAFPACWRRPWMPRTTFPVLNIDAVAAAASGCELLAVSVRRRRRRVHVRCRK